MKKVYNMPVSLLWYVKQTLLLLATFILPALALWLLFAVFTDDIIPLRLGFSVCLVCFICFLIRYLNHRIILDDKFIEVRYGLGYFRYRLKYQDISEVEIYGSHSKEYKEIFGKITSNKYSENVVRVGMPNLRSIYVYVSDEETKEFYDDLKSKIDDSKNMSSIIDCKVALSKADIIISVALIAVSVVLTILLFTKFQQYKIWALLLFVIYSLSGVRLVFRNAYIKDDKIVQNFKLFKRNISLKDVEKYKRIGENKEFVIYRLFMNGNSYRDVTVNVFNSESFIKKAEEFNIKEEK